MFRPARNKSNILINEDYWSSEPSLLDNDYAKTFSTDGRLSSWPKIFNLPTLLITIIEYV